jgi:hypothetical protein
MALAASTVTPTNSLEDFRIEFNNLVSDVTGIASTNKFSSNILPSTADGYSIGSTSLEWSDLYLADGSVIYFGADQDVNITHVHNSGLTTSGNFTVTGDLTVTGDDLTMGTNTSGAVLVADGTNFNPVVVSGDATIATNGALTIAATSVEGSMLNNNIISGLTALTSGLATTDEVIISDAGTIKRMDVSLIADLSAADATALAIALG